MILKTKNTTRSRSLQVKRSKSFFANNSLKVVVQSRDKNYNVAYSIL